MRYAELKKEDYVFIQKNVPSFFVEYTGTKPIENKNYILFPMKNDNEISHFETALNFSIVYDGMDDQDTVNGIGKRLYNIYDSFEIVED